MIRLLCAVVLLVSVFSCKNEKAKPVEDSAARAGTEYLPRSEVMSVIRNTSGDSAEKANNYIKNWARETILLQKAMSTLEEDDSLAASIEKQLEDYRNSLIVYAYEKNLVKRYLDTIVPSSEIEKYYQENQQNFELKENIVKVLYLRLPKNAPDLKKIRSWYKSDEPKDRANLEKYCMQHALNYFLDDQAWLYFDDLLKEIPIKTYNQEQFLQNNRYIEFEDSTSAYFVNIKGFKIKDSSSPLSFEEQNIRNIILNKRKLELIRKFRDDLYNEAIKNNDIEFYH